MFGLDLGLYIAGAFITETVLNLPGIGLLAVRSIFNADFPTVIPTVMGITVLGAFIIVVANPLVDVAYAFLDHGCGTSRSRTIGRYDGPMEAHVNVVALAKFVPDPQSTPQLGADGLLVREGAGGALDPGDEYGLELALQLAEAGGGEVTIVSMGPPEAVAAVMRGPAMGAPRGVLVADKSPQMGIKEKAKRAASGG